MSLSALGDLKRQRLTCEDQSGGAAQHNDTARPRAQRIGVLPRSCEGLDREALDLAHASGIAQKS